MNTDSITLSRDSILQRRLARSPRPTRRPSTTSRTLHIIVEEDERSSRSPSPMPACSSSQKARRRHHNLSACDIQIARDFVGIGADDEALSDGDDRLLLVPPSSARLPPTPSPVPSPDSFSLKFTDGSYKFPHPPIPTPTMLSSKNLSSYCGSPTFSSSSLSSPSGASAGMPLTPSTSDEEDFFELPSPRFNPRRAAIQPLVIHKHLSSSLPVLELDVPEKTPDTFYNSFSLSPYTSSDESANYDESESDIESDSEWYSQELGKIVTVNAPLPANFPCQSSRPDSILGLPAAASSAKSKRESSVFVAPGVPSGQLDPAFPTKRASKRTSRFIPNYPPPPPPVVPAIKVRPASNVPSSPVSPPHSRMSFYSSTTASSPRPPPRNSVPADFAFEDDAASEFSFAMYAGELDPRARAPTPGSAFSQMSFPCSESTYESDFGSPLDQAEFDLDAEYPMMLPLSLPGTPIDLEADIAHGLEELRSRSAVVSPSPLPVVLEECQDEEIEIYDAYERPATPPPPADDAWSWSVSSPALSRAGSQEPVLKSKWSSSTLASVREEHERRSSSKLKAYFGHSPSKKSGHKKTPSVPLSPMSFIGGGSPAKKKRVSGRQTVEYPPISAVSGVGVRRRGSLATVSDAGSEETTSSTSSSGLRRKPIPVELFMRR